MAKNNRNAGHYKLTQKQQMTVVQLAKQGMPFNLIARRFGVSHTTIRLIMTRFGFSKGWRRKKIEKMKQEKIQLVRAELKRNPKIGMALKKHGSSYSILWYRGLSLKNSKEFKTGKRLRNKFLKCKKCGASLENNRFDRNLLCIKCGLQYSNEVSKRSKNRKKRGIRKKST